MKPLRFCFFAASFGLTTMASAVPARAEPPKPGRGTERVLLVIHGGGRAEGATRARDAFVEHGFVRADHTVVARATTAEGLAGAMADVRAMAARHTPREVLLLAVIVGRPGDAAGETLRLGDGTSTVGPTVLVGDVLASLADIPAIARVAFTDVCEAGAAASRDALSLGVERGVVHLRARGTCHLERWLTGLGGAADENDDRRTTVAESYQFLREEGRAGDGPANPHVTVPTTADAPTGLRDPALDVILSQDTSFMNAAELVVPRVIVGEHAPLYRVFVYGETVPFAEAHARENRDVRIQVPKGRLVLHVLGEDEARGLDLRVSATEVRHIGPTEGRAMSAELLAQDRGVLSKPVHEVTVAYGGALGGYAVVAHGGGLRYAYAHPTYAFSMVGTAFLAGTSTVENENLYTVFGARARAERRFFSGVPLVAIGAGFVGELSLQSVRRKDASVLAQTGYPVEERYRAGGFGPEVFAALRTTVGGTSFFGLEVAAVFPFAPVGENLQAFPRLEGSLYAGLGF